MRATVSRGALTLTPSVPRPWLGSLALPLTAPIDDLVGLRGDAGYVGFVLRSYVPLFLEQWPDLDVEWPWPEIELSQAPELVPAEEWAEFSDRATSAAGAFEVRVQREVKRWVGSGLPELFSSAARQAQRGNFSATLAPYLERIRRHPGAEPDEVFDLPTLATFALDEALRRQPVRVAKCRLCGVPWIVTRPDELYCRRPSPGRKMVCEAVKKDERFRETQREWRREYRRLHERRRRGTLSEEVWRAWRAENRPSQFTRLEEWERKRSVVSSRRSFPVPS